MTKKKSPTPPKVTHKSRQGGTVIKQKPSSETTNETDKA